MHRRSWPASFVAGRSLTLTQSPMAGSVDSSMIMREGCPFSSTSIVRSVARDSAGGNAWGGGDGSGPASISFSSTSGTSRAITSAVRSARLCTGLE